MLVASSCCLRMNWTRSLSVTAGGILATLNEGGREREGGREGDRERARVREGGRGEGERERARRREREGGREGTITTVRAEIGGYGPLINKCTYQYRTRKFLCSSNTLMVEKSLSHSIRRSVL